MFLQVLGLLPTFNNNLKYYQFSMIDKINSHWMPETIKFT